MKLLPNRFSRPALTAASLVIAAAGLASGARAQCDVYRPGLPDFDQRREAAPGILGLPNNGSMHCVPTSAADAVAYAANHGAPQLTLNNIWDWDSPGTYNVATGLIGTLATLMGTSEDGTTSGGYVNGMTTFINNRAPGQFVVSSIGWANGFGPSPERVHNIIAQGGLVLIVRGTYAPEAGNPGVLERTGGHVLLARNVYDACSASPEIGMRDPNSSDSKFVNSPWGVYREDMNQFNATYRLWNGTTQQRNYWEWSDDYGQNHKVMDGLLTFIPTFALTGVVVNGEEVGVNIVRPLNLAGPIQNPPAPPEVDTLLLPPTAGPITSLELMPDLNCIVVFTRTAGQGGGGAGKVSMNDISFDRTFHDGPEFLTPVIDSCTSPSGIIYACEANRISLLARMQDGSIRVISSSVSPDPIHACGYDDAGRTVAVITGASGGAQPHVRVFDGNTGAPLHDFPLPREVQFEGAVGLCVDPSDGSLLCCSEGRDVIYRLARDSENATGGMQIGDANSIIENSLVSNGPSGNGLEMQVDGDANRIDSNSFYLNGAGNVGVQINGSGEHNFIVRNTFSGTGGLVFAGAGGGPRGTLYDLRNYNGAFDSDQPWANFLH